MKSGFKLAEASLLARVFSRVTCVLRLTFWALVLVSPRLSAAAMPEPASQTLLRQQEQQRALREQQASKPDVRLTPPAVPPGDHLPTDEQPCFAIKALVLEGEASAHFLWAMDAANHTSAGVFDAAAPRCLGARGINQIMQRMQNAIIARGFITTRVLAEPQDLRSGTLRLTLVPGRIHAMRFADGAAGGDSTRATLWNAMPVREGDLLNLRDIEQGLENLKRVPTAEADIQVKPAEGADVRPGDSDLLIAWRQGLPLRLTLSADDAGSKSTGLYQGSATVSCDHCSRLNDLFYVSFAHDLGGGDPGVRGTHGHAIHYSVPLDYWLLALDTSENRYHQAVAGANQTYIYSGESSRGEITLSRLVYRDAMQKSTLAMRVWTNASKNFIDDTEVEVQRRRMAGWEASANHRAFIRDSTLDLSLAYRHGTGAMDALPAPEEAFDEGTSRAEIVTAETRLNLPFDLGDQHFRYGGVLRAQWGLTPLVPQDRFAIGSRYSVRGFDGENLLLGDRGWLIRNELGWVLGESRQELYLGLDHGEVGGPSSEILAGTRLTGAALGLRGGYKGLSYDVFLGQPIAKPEGFHTPDHVAGFSIIWSI